MTPAPGRRAAGVAAAAGVSTTVSDAPVPSLLVHAALRTASLCWSAPLVTGVTIFVAWLVTRDNRLEDAGFWTMLAGSALALLGLLVIAVATLANLRSPDDVRRRVWISLSVTAGLILSNFPVAIALTIAWNRIETRNTVVIANEADVPATGVRVFGSGVDDDFGTLAPNKAKARSFRVTNTTDSDGPLFLSATLDGTSTTWSLGRVTEHVDSHFVVTLEGGGTIVVENEGVGNFRVDASGQSTRLDAPPFGARRTEPREGPPPTPADSR